MPKTSLDKENLLKTKPSEEILGSKPSPITKKRSATKMGENLGSESGPITKGEAVKQIPLNNRENAQNHLKYFRGCQYHMI